MFGQNSKLEETKIVRSQHSVISPTMSLVQCNVEHTHNGILEQMVIIFAEGYTAVESLRGRAKLIIPGGMKSIATKEHVCFIGLDLDTLVHADFFNPVFRNFMLTCNKEQLKERIMNLHSTSIASWITDSLVGYRITLAYDKRHKTYTYLSQIESQLDVGGQIKRFRVRHEETAEKIIKHLNSRIAT